MKTRTHEGSAALVGRAISNLRQARMLLILAGAVKADAKVLRALKSAEGALRNAESQRGRATPPSPYAMTGLGWGDPRERRRLGGQ